MFYLLLGSAIVGASLVVFWSARKHMQWVAFAGAVLGIVLILSGAKSILNLSSARLFSAARLATLRFFVP